MIYGLQSDGLNSPQGSSPSREQRLTRHADEETRLPGEVRARFHQVERSLGRRSKEDARGFTDEEKSRLQQLQQRDHEVRMHEQAHIAAAGGLVQGGPKYTLVKGPDGQMYAIGGHVHLDTSPESSPDATIEKAKRIKAAALAPGDPSSQDLRVAARASMMEMRARGELREKESEDPFNRLSDHQKLGSADAAEARNAFDVATGEEGEPATSSRSPFGGETAESPLSAYSSHPGRHRINSPGHLADCPHCQQYAFAGRFNSGGSRLLGVA